MIQEQEKIFLHSEISNYKRKAETVFEIQIFDTELTSRIHKEFLEMPKDRETERAHQIKIGKRLKNISQKKTPKWPSITWRCAYLMLLIREM